MNKIEYIDPKYLKARSMAKTHLRSGGERMTVPVIPASALQWDQDNQTVRSKPSEYEEYTTRDLLGLRAAPGKFEAERFAPKA